MAKTLGEFLREEIEQRNMSIRAFAEFMGVTHVTVLKFIEYGESEDAGYPSMEFLIKLARATHRDIRYIITLIAPDDVVLNGGPDPELLYLSKRINELPPEYRKVIEVIVSAGLTEE
jgi:transcriptional regulator with XRE-family HTH domain